ncbi:glucose-6-phosphate dehydrogenase assembly protein OpcA [Tautonia sociabilis]|uniref:Glucose-6-phosphate dehydrogenase n=1 Tax=Tautonia sociabilis TaxID=2080755 RepID=A0A432MRF3_9BACT|nr:glucose-6-phosphate dehydrogenase assembly protein OpcA [Tautonia sociabilis]RUL89508.1 glucose-6-phosphate dehydrogenase [Tautonia sociabilis]
MPPSQADAFYEGQGVPVDLAGVEDALDRLWGPAAEKAGGPELDDPAVTRVALANVVLVHLGADRAGMDETTAAITTRYPSRLIVVRPTSQGGRRLVAEVSAQCHLPAPGRPQVCSEQIILRVGPDGLDLIPGAVRSLLESDLHTVLWWCDDPATAPDLLGSLAEGATRVILDLPDPEADPGALSRAVEGVREHLPRDISWFGLTPWRSLIAELFDPPASSDLDRIESIRIRVLAERSDRLPRTAVWLVSWLAGQLGWRPEDRSLSDDVGRLDARFHSKSGPVRVSIETELAEVGPMAHIASVELGLRGDSRPAGMIRIARNGTGSCEVRIDRDDRPAPSCPRIVKAPEYDTERRVSAALLTDRNDPPYRRALPISRWLLGG